MKPYQGCVYLATNTVNGKLYIGKTVSRLAVRKWLHIRHAQDGSPLMFHRAIRKYGPEAFEWSRLFQSDDNAALLDAERSLILMFRTCAPGLYNMTFGGEPGPSGFVRSEEFRERMRNRVISEKTRQRIREVNTGRKRTPEQVEKMRQTKIGKNLPGWSPERRAKIEATWAAKKGQPMPDEQKAKISASRRAAMTDELRALSVESGKKGAASRWGR